MPSLIFFLFPFLFSSLSFFESELIRKGKGAQNLSEMFIVRNAYIGKAENYLRMYGTFNFGQGGAFHDIPWVIKRYGIVPESVIKQKEFFSNFEKSKKPNGFINLIPFGISIFLILLIVLGWIG